MISTASRDNRNVNRSAVEAALVAGGLVQVAGGDRFTYYGIPGQGRDGAMVRVGIKAFRRVTRWRSIHGGGIQDMTTGKENFHGKVDLAKVTAWAKALVDSKFGTVALQDRPGVVRAASGPEASA